MCARRIAILTFVSLLVAAPVLGAAATSAVTPRSGRVISVKPWRVALTFDDGPTRHTTPEVLSILEKEKVPATFFVVGRQVKPNAAVIQRMVKDGFVVGDHSWSHPWLTHLSSAEVHSQIEKTIAAIDAAVPNYKVNWFRVPYGAVNPQVVKDIYAAHLGIVWWTADDRGYRRPGTARRLKNVLEDAGPCGIILMHDTERGTVTALPEIIAVLRKKGAVFVTVPEMVASAAKLPKIEYPRRGWSEVMVPPAVKVTQ